MRRRVTFSYVNNVTNESNIYKDTVFIAYETSDIYKNGIQYTYFHEGSTYVMTDTGSTNITLDSNHSIKYYDIIDRNVICKYNENSCDVQLNNDEIDAEIIGDGVSRRGNTITVSNPGTSSLDKTTTALLLKNGIPYKRINVKFVLSGENNIINKPSVIETFSGRSITYDKYYRNSYLLEPIPDSITAGNTPVRNMNINGIKLSYRGSENYYSGLYVKYNINSDNPIINGNVKYDNMMLIFVTKFDHNTAEEYFETDENIIRKIKIEFPGISNYLSYDFNYRTVDGIPFAYLTNFTSYLLGNLQYDIKFSHDGYDFTRHGQLNVTNIIDDVKSITDLKFLVNDNKIVTNLLVGDHINIAYFYTDPNNANGRFEAKSSCFVGTNQISPSNYHGFVVRNDHKSGPLIYNYDLNDLNDYYTVNNKYDRKLTSSLRNAAHSNENERCYYETTIYPLKLIDNYAYFEARNGAEINGTDITINSDYDNQTVNFISYYNLLDRDYGYKLLYDENNGFNYNYCYIAIDDDIKYDNKEGGLIYFNPRQSQKINTLKTSFDSNEIVIDKNSQGGPHTLSVCLENGSYMTSMNYNYTLTKLRTGEMPQLHTYEGSIINIFEYDNNGFKDNYYLTDVNENNIISSSEIDICSYAVPETYQNLYIGSIISADHSGDLASLPYYAIRGPLMFKHKDDEYNILKYNSKVYVYSIGIISKIDGENISSSNYEIYLSDGDKTSTTIKPIVYSKIPGYDENEFNSHFDIRGCNKDDIIVYDGDNNIIDKDNDPLFIYSNNSDGGIKVSLKTVSAQAEIAYRTIKLNLSLTSIDIDDDNIFRNEEYCNMKDHDKEITINVVRMADAAPITGCGLPSKIYLYNNVVNSSNNLCQFSYVYMPELNDGIGMEYDITQVSGTNYNDICDINHNNGIISFTPKGYDHSGESVIRLTAPNDNTITKEITIVALNLDFEIVPQHKELTYYNSGNNYLFEEIIYNKYSSTKPFYDSSPHDNFRFTMHNDFYYNLSASDNKLIFKQWRPNSIEDEGSNLQSMAGYPVEIKFNITSDSFTTVLSDNWYSYYNENSVNSNIENNITLSNDYCSAQMNITWKSWDLNDKIYDIYNEGKKI